MNDTYRQITFRLRVQRGPGRKDLVSERPHKKDRHDNRIYTDSDEKPTLVRFDKYCQVDIPSLLQLGAIIPYTPPKPTKEVRTHGEAAAESG